MPNRPANLPDYAQPLNRRPANLPAWAKPVSELQVFTGQEGTGRIDTRTDKEITRPTYTQEEPASLWTLSQVATVDDPGTKIKIFAKARGISPDRYQILGGKIHYQGQDGRYFPESHPDNIIERGKEFAGGMYGKKEPIIGGIIGSVMGGPPGAALGAASGEGFRKSKAALMEDESQTIKDNVIGMATEGVLGGVAEVPGRIVAGAVARQGLKKGGQLAKAAGRSAVDIDPLQYVSIRDMGRKYGIELNPAQITEAKDLIDKWSLVSDMPQTSRKMGVINQQQADDVERALTTYLDQLNPSDLTPYDINRRGVQAAEGAIDGLRSARQELTGPYYKEAFKDKPQVEMGSVFDEIESLKAGLPESDVTARNAVEKIETMLQKGKVPETDLAKLDVVKKQIDDIEGKIIADEGASSAKKEALWRIDRVRKELNKTMEAADKYYKEGKKVYATLSPRVEQAQKGLTGEIAKLVKEKQISKAAQTIFNPRNKVEVVKRAKDLIKKQDPDAWNAMVGDHLNDIFQSVKKTGTKNLGGQFAKKTVKDQRQLDILRVAMEPEQFKNFNDFVDILRRSGLTSGKESATATRQEMIKQAKRESGGVAVGTLKAIRSLGDTALQGLDDVFLDKYMVNLADALTSEKAAIDLQKMRKLKPGSKKLIEQFATFSTLVASGGYRGAKTKKADKQ